MTEDTVAKPLIKDRFWILSKEGKSIGMLNKLGEMFVVTENGHKSAFENKKNLLKKYPLRFIKFGKEDTRDTKVEGDVYNYPINTKSGYNTIFDLARKLPMFTKRNDSKCWFCAGHYIINFNKIGWTTAYCPKLITLDRYGYKGPYKSVEDAKEALKYVKSTT